MNRDETPRNLLDRVIRQNYPLALVGLAAFIVLILGLRTFNAVFYPVLHCEDGTEMLAYYWNHPYPVEIFRFYMGYISLIPNAVGFLSTFLFPLHVAPYVMVLFSLGIATTALSLFALRRFRPIMPDDKSRMLVCLMLALLPLGNFAMLTNLTYSMWHILLIAIVLMAAPPPKSTIAKLFQFIFIVLASWSHPLSILLIPIGVVLFFARPSLLDRIGNIGIVISTTAYAMFGVQAASSNATLSGETLIITYHSLMHRVIFESVFGNHARDILEHTTYPWLINVLALGISVLLVLAIWSYHKKHKSKINLVMVGFLTFVIFAITFLSIAGRSMELESIVVRWGHRYFYLQQLLFAFLVILYIIRTVEWKTMATSTRVVMAALAAIYIISLNVYNEGFFTTSKEQGVETIEFLKEAERQMNTGEGVKEPFIFSRGGEWDIKLIPHP